MGFMAPKMLEMFEEAMQKNEKKSTSSKYKDYVEVEKASKNMKTGGKVSSASKRADGIAIRGKTKA
jgi:hypothetical protein